MQTKASQKIIGRFFEAIQILKANGVIRGQQTFAVRYDINRRNLYQLEKNMEKDIFQVAWLQFLIEDYKVSPFWFFTEEKASFFQEGWDAEKVKILQKSCKKSKG